MKFLPRVAFGFGENEEREAETTLKCSFPQFCFSELQLTTHLEGSWGSDSFALPGMLFLLFFLSFKFFSKQIVLKCNVHIAKCVSHKCCSSDFSWGEYMGDQYPAPADPLDPD